MFNFYLFFGIIYMRVVKKMNAKFILNDYALIWNLLFQSSYSDTIYALKQKLWNTYKVEYNETFKDKNLIMKDPKNFIPNDDTIYNNVLEERGYEKIKKQTEKYRREIMKVWDKNKKETDNLYNNIIRKEMPEYTFFVVNKELNIINHPQEGSLVIGKKIDDHNPTSILLEMNMIILNNNIKKYKAEEAVYMKAILELAVLNEYATNLTKKSCYISGDNNLITLKRSLYPYWLMYLGVPKDKFLSYMMRDKISFDVKKYPYEKELKKMNIEEFIDFCIRNKRYMSREIKEEII